MIKSLVQKYGRKLTAVLILLAMGITAGAGAGANVQANVTMFEDGSAQVYGRSVCLVTSMGCGDWLGEEWLDSSEGDPAGYLVIGDSGNTLVCFHEANTCYRANK